MYRSSGSSRPGDKGGRNKRKTGRVNVNFEGKYEFNLQQSSCMVTNLSPSGAALKVPQFFSEGDVLRVFFELPSKITIDAWSEVRYMKGSKIGIQFTQIRDEDKAALEAFVKRETSKLLHNLASNHFKGVTDYRKRF